MAADFPSSVHTFTVVTDGVTYWTKALIEERDDEVAALETYLISTTRTENTLFAGPTTAPAAAPTWRALVAADLPAATTTAQGAVELATSAETQTGTDTDRAVTPAGLRSDIPAAPAASRGVRLDASGHLVMPDDGRAEFTALAGTLSVLFDMYSDTVTHRWEASFRKSHQDTEGNTATIDTDILGGVSWYGNDGSGFTSAAAILVEQDGAASTYTPAAIVFLVADGTNAPAEVGRFSKDGYFGINIDAPEGLLHTALDAAYNIIRHDTYSTTDEQNTLVRLRKSSSGTLGTIASTADGERLGTVTWQGANTTPAFATAAYVVAIQNGAATADYVPGDLVFYTSSGSAAAAEAMRITKDKDLSLAAGAVILTNGEYIGVSASDERINFYTAGYVAVMGADLGVGVASPSTQFHVYEDTNASVEARVENPDGSGTGAYASLRATASTASVVLISHGDARVVTRYGVTLGGYSEVLVSAGSGLLVGTVVGVPVIIGTNNAERVRITGDGDVLLGTTTKPSANSGKVLVFGDNAADPTMDTDTAGIYAKDDSGVEMFAIDEADNAAQLTPHNFSGPVQPIAGTLHWSQYHRNRYLGVEKWYDMERALLALEALTGQTFIHTQQLPFNERLNWEQEQVKRLRAAMARGESYKVKPRPSWM